MNHFSSLPLIFALATTAGFAIGAEHSASSQNSDRYPDAIAHPDELFMRDLATRMFPSLPQEQQAKIAQAGGIGSDDFDLSGFTNADERDLSHIPKGITATEFLGMLLSDDIREALSEQQLIMIDDVASSLDQGMEMPAMCFAPGTDPRFAYLMDQMFDFQFVSEDGSRFQQVSRWSSTASSGGGLGQGDPTLITYSFAPDGSFVPNTPGLGSGTSFLFQWMNDIYGTPANWQPLFHSVFDRWAELTGTSYVWEENDDGQNMDTGFVSSPGVLGVRGDVRIFAYDYPLDGNFGVLAFNYFPNNGDMAFDAFDSFYNSTSSNSLRLRNVTAHEHGHGLGMAHVCPANQTKLMEPFISTAYNGPQLDDILNGIRHYGDVLEPNNNTTQATDLGIIPITGSAFMDNLGVDDNSDNDYFRIQVEQSSQIFFTATPDADSYIQGPQTSSCDTGSMTNYNAVQDLEITVVNSSGTILDSSNAVGAGAPETIIFDALFAGEYFFVVNGATNVNSIQRYRMDVEVEGLGFIDPVIIATIPETVNPGFESPFFVTITPQSDIIIPGSEKLFYAANGNPFIGIDLVFVEGSQYTATIPAAACNDNLAVYIGVEGETAGQVTFPTAGASGPFNPTVNDFSTIFVDDFEEDLGWTVSGPVTGALSGEWERGVPIGFGNRGDPTIDADFSGSAFLTGNVAGNSDVDGGQTILTSPIFAMGNNPDALISYSRWYDNTGAGTGTAPGLDVFTVEISNNNGGSWTPVEVVGPDTAQSVGGWFSVEHRVADFVTPTDQIRVRFIAEDIGDGSVVEAGLDAFLTGARCEEPKIDCIADFTNDGILDFFDVSAFLTGFNTQNPISDLTNDGIYDFFDISTFLQAFAAGCP